LWFYFFALYKYSYLLTYLLTRDFAVSSAVVWNSLLAALRVSSLTVETFARQLKYDLFSCLNWRSWGLFILRYTNVLNIILWPTIHSDGQAIMFYACGSFSFFSMAAHSNGQYFAAVVSIFFFLLLLSFLAQSQRSEIGCLPYFHTWCGLSANLECMSEICCTRLAENTECNNYAKNCHLRCIAQLCWAIPSKLRHVSTV